MSPPERAQCERSRSPIRTLQQNQVLIGRCNELDSRSPDIEAAMAYRDMLMVLLGAYLPLRSANLGSLALGRSLTEINGTYRVEIAAAITKTGAAVSSFLPIEVAELVRRYVVRYRPLLLGTAVDGGHLWLSREGTPLVSVYRVFRRVGCSMGLPALRPHAMRHTAATVMLARDPTDLGTAAALLTYRGYRSVSDVYDRSGTAGAHRAWQLIRRRVAR